MPKTVPADYQCRVRKPDDFDAFWQDVVRQAAAIPLDVEVVPDPLRTSDDVEVFEIFYTSVDHVRIAEVGIVELERECLATRAHVAHERERSRDRHISALLDRQIDGIMIDALGAASLTEKLLERTNVVLIDEPPDRWPGVASDAFGAGRQAAEHLLALGHERFAFLGPATDIHAIRMRERGFVQTIARAGFKIASDRLRRVAATASGGQAGMRVLLGLEPRPTAVFCSNDMVAIGALKMCSVARARVPTDILIVGCDDIELASLTYPELTTVAIPARELGARAVRLLLHALKTEEQEGRVESPVQKTMASRLVVRGTTASPPNRTTPT